MKNRELKVSIVMPVFKASTTIEHAVESIIQQSYKNWELIIIDDCCPDSSCDLVKNLVNNSIQIILINNISNQGVAVSRNIGIAQATGELIAFLDADDYWQQEKLERQVAKIEEGFDLVCANYYRIASNGKTTEVHHKEEFSFEDMLKSNQVGNLTGMYRCDNLGKIYQKPIGHEDYLMWLEVIKIAKIGYCIQQPLACYRVSEKSLSSNKFKTISWQWIIYRRELKLSLFKSTWFFLNYIYAAFTKRI